MGGIYGDKESTLARFKENYTTKLSDRIKARLVLENDEVGQEEVKCEKNMTHFFTDMLQRR